MAKMKSAGKLRPSTTGQKSGKGRTNAEPKAQAQAKAKSKVGSAHRGRTRRSELRPGTSRACCFSAIWPRS